MDFLHRFCQKLWQLHPADFEQAALSLFAYQAEHCQIYRQYLHLLGKSPQAVRCLADIPYLPISLFKQHRILSTTEPPQIVFSSSGTTGTIPSQHYVAQLDVYESSFLESFKRAYADPASYCILALLPAYLEREGSSLVYMANRLIGLSRHPDSGFYLHDYHNLAQLLRRLVAAKQPTILLGVSFALCDLAEQYPQPLPDSHLIVMETGGMKGKRRELIRAELHELLKNAFQRQSIHAEYGMTELLSQAYSYNNGIYRCPTWMHVSVSEINDPLSPPLPPESTGTINIIDLANAYSCAFIATSDLGKTHQDGSFEILGRVDNSDMRGCNLLVS